MSALPNNDYLAAYLAEAMRLYHAALPTATDAQRLVWQHISREKFVEEAWPYAEPNLHMFSVVALALTLVVESGMTLEAALMRAKREARKWPATPQRYVRHWEAQWRKRAARER